MSRHSEISFSGCALVVNVLCGKAQPATAELFEILTRIVTLSFYIYIGSNGHEEVWIMGIVGLQLRQSLTAAEPQI